MPSSVVGSIAGSVASAGVSKLLGGGKSGGGNGTAPFTNLNAGGLATYIDKNGKLAIASTSKRQGLIDSLANSNRNQAAYTRGLIPTVSSNYGGAIDATNTMLSGLGAGYGDITKSRVGTIQNAAAKSESDLRSNLARRRVLGSSFANNDISNIQAEYAKQEADARAKSYLEELDATTKLIDNRLQYQKSQLADIQSLTNDAFSYERAADSTQLAELDAQLSVVTGLISSINNINQQNAQTAYNNSLAAGKAAGGLTAGIGNSIGGFLSSGGSSIFNNLGQSVGSIFSSSPTGPYLPFGF